MNKFDLTLILLLSLLPAYGAMPDSTIQSTIDEVTVIGDSPATSPTTQTSQTIRTETTARLGVSDVSDAIRRMAGADIRDYGGIGGLKTISVRSLGSKHTTVTYDGVALSDCQNGQIDLGRFSLDQLASLKLTISADNEILRPAKDFALPSLLELQSAKPTYDKKRHHTNAKLTIGSFGLINPTLQFDHQIGTSPFNFVKASADYLRAEGDYPYTLTNGQQQSEERRQNTATESGHAEIDGRILLSPERVLSGKAYYYTSNRQLPGSVVFYDNNNNKEQLSEENFFAQIRFRSDHWKRFSFLANGKFNWAACHYHDEARMYPNGEVNNDYFQREWYASGVTLFKASPTLSIANATDYTYNGFNSNLATCPFPKRHSFHNALSIRFQKRSRSRNRLFTATATALGSYFKNQVEKGDSPTDQKRLSPSVALAIKPFATDLFFRASFKDVFRMPTFNELYFDATGSKKLAPERTKQYNVGMTYQYTPNETLQTLSLSADAYHNEVNDKIVAMPRMFVWSIINMGRVEIKGVDCTMNCGIATSHHTSLSLSGKYTYQQAVDKTNEKSEVYGDQIPYAPLHAGNGSIAFENPILNIAYKLDFVGQRFSQPQNSKANKIDAYTEHGLTIYRKLKFKHFETELRGDALNLTDQQYEVVKYYPMPGRSYKVAMEFKF